MESCYRHHAMTARNPQRAPVLPITACASVPRRECRRRRGGFFATTIDSAVYIALDPELRELLVDPLLLGVRRHVEGLVVELGRLLLVPLRHVGLGEAVVDVPGPRMVLDVLLESLDRLVGLLLAEELVAVVVHLGFRRERQRPRAQGLGRLGVPLLLEE